MEILAVIMVIWWILFHKKNHQCADAIDLARTPGEANGLACQGVLWVLAFAIVGALVLAAAAGEAGMLP